MGTPVPPSVVAAFAFGGTVNVDYTLIPVPSQVGVSPELASFTTGFPPTTRTARTSGGIPPRGLDMNGILFMVSAHAAWASAGNAYSFNADVVATATGYNIGAILRSAVDPAQYFYNTVADNANNPDSVLTGWVPFSPLATPIATLATNVGAGAQVVAVTAATGFADLTPNAGATTVTNFTGGNVGQIMTVTNMDAVNPLTLQANANIRMAGDVTLLQNGSLTLRRRTSTEWVALS